MGLAGGLATNGVGGGGGGAGTVTSVTAADGTIVVAGTASAPTVAVGTGIPVASITGAASTAYVDRSIKAVFGSPGVQAVKTGQGRYYVVTACTILGALASLGTAPTGATFIIDVLKNGTTIYTGGTNRPTIATSGFVSATTLVAPAVTALAIGDYLTVNVAQIGSSVAGSDLTVIVFAN